MPSPQFSGSAAILRTSGRSQFPFSFNSTTSIAINSTVKFTPQLQSWLTHQSPSELANSSPTACSRGSRWSCKCHLHLRTNITKLHEPGRECVFSIQKEENKTNLKTLPAMSSTPTAPTSARMTYEPNSPRCTSPTRSRSTCSACAHSTVAANPRALRSFTTRSRR